MDGGGEVCAIGVEEYLYQGKDGQEGDDTGEGQGKQAKTTSLLIATTTGGWGGEGETLIIGRIQKS